MVGHTQLSLSLPGIKQFPGSGGGHVPLEEIGEQGCAGVAAAEDDLGQQQGRKGG